MDMVSASCFTSGWCSACVVPRSGSSGLARACSPRFQDVSLVTRGAGAACCSKARLVERQQQANDAELPLYRRLTNSSHDCLQKSHASLWAASHNIVALRPVPRSAFISNVFLLALTGSSLFHDWTRLCQRTFRHPPNRHTRNYCRR